LKKLSNPAPDSGTSDGRQDRSFDRNFEDFDGFENFDGSEDFDGFDDFDDFERFVNLYCLKLHFVDFEHSADNFAAGSGLLLSRVLSYHFFEDPLNAPPILKALLLLHSPLLPPLHRCQDSLLSTKSARHQNRHRCRRKESAEASVYT